MDDEPHPLDRDYSEPIKRRRRRRPWTLRRFGFTVFAAGCLSLLPAAAVATSYPSTWIETLAGQVHHLGMIAILIGGLAVITGYRLEGGE